MSNEQRVYQPHAEQEQQQTAIAPAPTSASRPALTLAEKNSISVGMDTVAGFEALQRCASMLASSDIVPEVYRGRVGNCAIALDISLRLRMSPVLIMQNLYVVKGKPSWSGQFSTAIINNSGLFDPLDWEWKGEEGDKKTTGPKSWGCRAFARDRRTGKVRYGQWIDWDLVVKEGWEHKPDRNGNETSKWQSMPAQMFIYRSSSFWMKQHYPQGLLGLPTAEEVEELTEVIDVTPEAPRAPEGALREQPLEQPKKKGTAAVKNAMRARAAQQAEPAPNSPEDLGFRPAEAEPEEEEPIPFETAEEEAAHARETPPESGQVRAPDDTAAKQVSAPKTEVEEHHERMVAWAKANPNSPIGDLMRQFRPVSLNRATAAYNEAHGKSEARNG